MFQIMDYNNKYSFVCFSLSRICKARLTDIIRHFDENGTNPRLGKKGPWPQAQLISSKQIDRVLDIIKNYTEDHAMILLVWRPDTGIGFRYLYTSFYTVVIIINFIYEAL